MNKRKRLNTTIENATAGWLKEWRERDNLSQGLVIDNVIAWALAQGWQPFNKS